LIVRVVFENDKFMQSEQANPVIAMSPEGLGRLLPSLARRAAQCRATPQLCRAKTRTEQPATWSESSLDCDEDAVLLILKPGQPAASYERGLRLVRAACRLEPDNGNLVDNLGVAQYRAGLVPEALATLTRSNALNQGRAPEDLAFLAMAHQRLGQIAGSERCSTGCAT
jgi:uncharacterized protein HemY